MAADQRHHQQQRCHAQQQQQAGDTQVVAALGSGGAEGSDIDGEGIEGEGMDGEGRLGPIRLWKALPSCAAAPLNATLAWTLRFESRPSTRSNGMPGLTRAALIHSVP